MRFFGRCLLAVNGRVLIGFLWLFFIVHLQRVSSLKVWLQLTAVALQADVLYVISFLLALFCASCWCCGIAASRGLVCNGRISFVLVVILLLTLGWHSLVKITVLHGLRLSCVIPSKWAAVLPYLECPESSLLLIHGSSIHCLGDRGPRDNPLGLFTSWLWIPIGLFCILWRTVFRPCVWVHRIVSLHGEVVPRNHAPLMWWEWREMLIGCLLWLTATQLIAGVTRTGARRILRRPPPLQQHPFAQQMSFAKYMLVTIFAFFLTVEPLVWFWRFLLGPAAVLFTTARRRDLRIEDCLAAMTLTWLLVRAAYIVGSACLERRRARRRADEGLRYALAFPFHAGLEDGFGNDGVCRAAIDTIGKAWRKDGESVETLQLKRLALVRERRRLLKEQIAGAAVLSSRLRLSIRRDHIVEDSLRELAQRSVAELVADSISVNFEGEVGIDAGGLTRDWFDSVAKALVEQVGEEGNGLFVLAPDDTLIPRPAKSYESEIEQARRLRSLLAVGRLLALAVVRERPLPLALSFVVCKHLLLRPLGMDDVLQLDQEFYQHRIAPVLQDKGVATLTGTLSEPLTFTSAPTELMREPRELIPGGAFRVVTDSNKEEYIKLLCEERLCGDIRCELQCMLQGFWDVLPLVLLQQIDVTPRALAVMICGVDDLDPAEWEYCSTSSSGSKTKVIRWFWDVVHTSFSSEQRCLLLHFATGSSRLPPGGFSRLQPPFSVHVATAGSPEFLPHAHTCINRLVLQDYASKQQLHDKLLRAISEDHFGIV